jgi:hypothetical protein
MSIRVKLTSNLLDHIKKRKNHKFHPRQLISGINKQDIMFDIRHIMDIAFIDNGNSTPLEYLTNSDHWEMLDKIKQSLDSGKIYSYTRHNFDRSINSPKTSIITIDDKLYLETDRLIELDQLLGDSITKNYRLIL